MVVESLVAEPADVGWPEGSTVLTPADGVVVAITFVGGVGCLVSVAVWADAGGAALLAATPTGPASREVFAFAAPVSTVVAVVLSADI